MEYMEDSMKFAVDAFGGDNAPSAIIEGCINAMEAYSDFDVILTGNAARIEEELKKYQYDKSRIEIVHAPDIIGCDETPTYAIKHKKESSLVKALYLVAENKADCFISAGSSGAILAGATLIVKRIPGIKRPGLAPIIPTLKGPAILIDCGANVDCKPEYLVQFAHMGSAYMSGVLGVENPKIGLINNGTEENKGNELTKAVYALLSADENINFCGNCEPRDVLKGDFHVMVCDGFVGNTILKTAEGTVYFLLKMMKTEIKNSKPAMFGALFSRNALHSLKKKIDYKEYGGAPLLGIRKGIIKAHGSSDAKAITSAIKQARKLILGNVTEKITDAVGRAAKDRTAAMPETALNNL